MILIALFLCLFMVQAANSLQPKAIEHETPESVDFEFTNIYDNAQDEQFDIVRSTPVVDDLKEGQIFIYLSTNSQHPILFLRAGTSNYIIRTEPYR